MKRERDKLNEKKERECLAEHYGNRYRPGATEANVKQTLQTTFIHLNFNLAMEDQLKGGSERKKKTERGK